MITLEQIRNCLEGAVPSLIATCDAEGVPNLSLVSQVHYFDDRHVALTFQFFNKTHRNVSANPQTTVYLTDPETAAQYRLALLYIRTETEGALFDTLKAKLAGIAENTRMQGIFHLKGADIYRVLDIQPVLPGNPCLALPQRPLLAQTRLISAAMLQTSDLASLMDTTVKQIATQMQVSQVSLLLKDSARDVLYTVASTDESGIGAEVPLGFGIIGECATAQSVIRIAFGASEYNYRNAIAHYSKTAQADPSLETAISFPELANPGSQLALPLILPQGLLGVLYLESNEKRRFTHEDEDALGILSDLFVSRFACLADQSGGESETPAPTVKEPVSGPGLEIRYYAANQSIFIDRNYLIKGVAGAIFWRLINQYQHDGRQDFSNRELRLDTSIGLPEISDNLESRLALLQKRLHSQTQDIAIEKSGRGRFRLRVTRPLTLLVEC